MIGICQRTGKFAFRSAAEAATKRAVLRRRHHGKRGNVNIFQCDFCGMWHHGRDGKPRPDRTEFRRAKR